MKTHFDWQTEESDQQENKEPLDSDPSGRMNPGCLTLTLIIVAGVISLLVWFVNDTQSKAVAGVKEEVLRTFELQNQAVNNHDEELFSAILSSRDPNWKRNQRELFAEILTGERTVLGLAEDSKPISQITLDESPDLQKAELSFIKGYNLLTKLRDDSELELLHYQFFVFENGRWMRSPADPAFWGPWNTVEGKYVEITYPERDAEFAQLLIEAIDNYLESLCRNLGAENYFGKVYCFGDLSWQIRLSIDDQALLNFSENAASKSRDFDYELPSPSLVGIPLDEKELNGYLNLYLEPIFKKMEAVLLSTVPLPNQNVYALCFGHSSGHRNLNRFDWRLQSWQPVLPAATFHYLSALPDDSMIMLAEGENITMINGNSKPSFFDSSTIRHENIPLIISQALLGWVETAESPYLLLMSLPSGIDPPRFSALDLQDCLKQNCFPEELPGFPIPSVTSDAALYVDGSEIILVPGKEQAEKLVGKGFSPFWINGDTFGFVRFQRDIDTNVTTQVVLGDISGDELQVLIDGHDLTSIGKIPWSDVLYIHEVIPNPVDSNKLIIAGTGLREYSGNYFIFSLDVSNRRIENAKHTLQLETSRQGSLVGIAGLLSPTGYPMMLVSPNGRWIAFVELNSQNRDTWTILIYDLLQGTTGEIIEDVPALPGNFPLLDWSDDGLWLIIADRDFLHLVAPGYGYQERIAHDFDACSQIVWAD